MRFVQTRFRAPSAKWMLACAAGAAASCLAVPSLAQDVTIIAEDANGQPVTVNTVGAGLDYLLVLPGAARRVKITTSGLGIDIGRLIFVGGPTAAPVDISLGENFGAPGANTMAVGRSWRGLDAADLFLSRFYGGIAGDLTGAITVDELVRLDTAGAIGASLACGTGAAGAVVTAREVRPESTISVNSGSLTELRATAGAMAGTVNLLNGSLGACNVAGDLTGKLNVPQGAIGFITVAGAIDSQVPAGTLWPIRAGNGIQSIVATRIDAKITTGADGGPGTLGLLKTTNGPFAGALYTRGVVPVIGAAESGVRVAGDVTASIDIRDQDLRAPVRITGSLLGALTISDSDGLRAQVIIGASGTGLPTWATDVGIGGVTLTTKPYYFRLPATMGLGAVGHAPFNVHFEDCTPAGARAPANPTTCGYFISALGPSVTPFVILRHYGPVGFTSGAGIGVRVSQRIAGLCAWTDVTQRFTTVLNPGGEQRAVRVEAAPGQQGFVGAPGYEVEYLIVPVLAGAGARLMVCADVNGNPAVHDYRYVLRVAAAVVPPPPPPPPPGTTTTRGNSNYRKRPVISDNQK